jgi:hypothetical protein
MYTRQRFGAAVLVAALALLGFTAGEGRAAVVFSMSFQVGNGTPQLIDPFATSSATSYNVSDLTGLNMALDTAGSKYNFSSVGGLSGTSNFPGSTIGQAILTGTVNAEGTGSNGTLTLTETVRGFTSPIGPLGTLASSSTADFTNVSAGMGETVSSFFGSNTVTTAGPYSLLSSSDITENTQSGSASQGLTPVTTLYTLENSIRFSLVATPGVVNPDVPAAPSDDFSTSATVSLAVTAVPEPASVIPLLTGALGLLGYGWRRRRQAAA